MISVFSAFIFFITGLLYIDSAKVEGENKMPGATTSRRFFKAFRRFFDKFKTLILRTSIVDMVKQFGPSFRSRLAGASPKRVIRRLVHEFRKVTNINLKMRAGGFLLLSLSSAANITPLNTGLFLIITQWLEISGLVIILTTLLKEPVLRPPESTVLALSPIIFITSFFSLIPITVSLYLAISLVYLRKVTESHERQYKPVFWAFLLLAISESLNIGFLWRNTNNVFLSNFLSEFGPLWIITRLIEFIGLIILAKWTLGYFRFRLASQLFITTVSTILFVFLVTTAFFTLLLLRNLEQDALSHLETNVKVLQFALERLQKEALSDAQSVVGDTAFVNAFKNKDRKKIYEITSDYLISQDTSFLAVTDKEGQVLMRAEDKEKIGDNIGSDSVVKSALSGQKLSTVITRPGVFLPIVEIKAAMPIVVNGVVNGTVVTGFLVDDAFVDGVKSITGLDITVFAGRRRAATTFHLPDGKSRAVGTVESSDRVISKVLEKGEIFIGPSQVLNQSYYTAYAPLKTYGDKTIGMLFVGERQTELINAANRSLQLTFLGSIILMIASIIPAYYISKYINDQMKA